jgi:branched-chain amino acid transport system substrate-binding protein
MTQTSIRLSRRRAMQGLAAVPVAVPVLAMPAIAQQKPIRLGWIAAVSGMFSSNALAQDWGFHTAVQDINDAGGIDGRKIEIVMRDSAADPAKAVSFAKELIFNQDIDGLCGPINSGEVLPTLGVVAAAKRIHMLGGSVDELIDPVKYPLAFRNLNTNTQYITTATNFLVDGHKRNKVAIIDDATGYGVIAMQALTKLLATRGLKPAYSVTVDPNKTDLTDEIVQARNAGADSIQTWTNATGFMARVLNARGEQQWDVPIAGNPSMFQGQVGALLTKPAYWDNAFAAGYANGVVDANGNLPPATQEFLDKHKVGVAPYIATGIFSFLQGHAAATIYTTGVRQAGTTDSFKVKAALESIPVIQTPYGPFSYTPTDHNGFADSGMVMVIANSQQPNGGLKAAKV